MDTSDQRRLSAVGTATTTEPVRMDIEDHHAETCRGLYETDPYDVLDSTTKPDCKTPYEWGEASAINPQPRP